MRVINDQEVRAAARHRTTNAHSKILAALVRVPPAGSLRVRLQYNLWIYLLVLVRVHQVTNLTAKTYSELSRVCRLNDLGPRLIAHDERRQQVGRELRLGVPRRHVDDQTLELAVHYPVECVRHLGMVFTNNGLGPYVLCELHEIFLRAFLRLKTGKTVFKLKALYF